MKLVSLTLLFACIAKMAAGDMYAKLDDDICKYKGCDLIVRINVCTYSVIRTRKCAHSAKTSLILDIHILRHFYLTDALPNVSDRF